MAGRDEGPRGVVSDFREAVNMTPGELEKWLASDCSRSAGPRPEEMTPRPPGARALLRAGECRRWR
jgi:hypothetical protein